MRALQVFFLLLATSGPAWAQDAPLRWKFKAGDSENYRLTQSARLELNLESGKRVEARVVRELEWQWKVSKAERDGSAWISVKVTSVRLKVTGPAGEETKFDSKSKEEPRGFAATLAPLFRTLMKSELEARMSSQGEVDIVDFKIPKDLEIVINTKPVGKALGTIASKEDLLPLVNLTLHALPDSPRNENQVWRAKQSRDTLPFGSTEATTIYRFESLDESAGKQIVTIIPETTIRFIDAEATKPVPRITSQESSGEILFDVTSGRVLSHDSTETLELETTGGGQSATGSLRHELKIEIIEASTAD